MRLRPLSLTADGSVGEFALGMNFLLAILLAVLTAQDLRRRDRGWQAIAIGISYIAAPLIGLVLYALASQHPIARGAAAAVRPG